MRVERMCFRLEEGEEEKPVAELKRSQIYYRQAYVPIEEIKWFEEGIDVYGSKTTIVYLHSMDEKEKVMFVKCSIDRFERLYEKNKFKPIITL